MSIGRAVIDELSNGNTYCDLLSRHPMEIEGIEEDLVKGVLPGVFKLHSSDGVLNPKTPEEFIVLLDLVDLKKSKFNTLQEVSDRVVNYPLTYYVVKKRVAECIRVVSMDNIKKTKKLNPALFKGMVHMLSRCTRAFTEGIIAPWISEGMTSCASLVLGRVIMKSSVAEREYLEEFIMNLLAFERSHSLYTLLTSALIKRVKLSEEGVKRMYDYILDGPMDQRYLTWNKVVLVFVRGYKQDISMEELKDIYSGSTHPIEKEIQKELSGEI